MISAQLTLLKHVMLIEMNEDVWTKTNLQQQSQQYNRKKQNLEAALNRETMAYRSKLYYHSDLTCLQI
jgi:hypothetical protein